MDRRPADLRAETFPAKRLLTPSRHEETAFFPGEYTLNLYRGCNHGCLYCDSRSECYHIDRFDQVRIKEHCLAMLERELRGKKRAGIVMMGAASDPYNGLEERLCLTRQALLLLKRYHFGVGIPTKGALVARDAELLAEMGKAAPAYVSFSITAAEDGLSRLLEPQAPPSSARFAAMGALARAGVFTGLWLNPVLPFLTDSQENLGALLLQTKENGGRYAICHFGMTLREGNREYFFAGLAKEPRFSGLTQRYADAFGLSYFCPSPQADALWRFFQAECQRLGLLFRFEDIAYALTQGCPEQLSMF